MKNKRGFTLIELLAVIIILAIVALIATPMILDVINDSRKSAAKSQTALVLDAAKLYYTEEYFKNDTNFEGYECSISNRLGCDELSLEGEKPDSAIISIDKNGYSIDENKCRHCQMCVSSKYIPGGCLMCRYLRTRRDA